jgi:mono/diheme cytochrome c family protein
MRCFKTMHIWHISLSVGTAIGRRIKTALRSVFCWGLVVLPLWLSWTAPAIAQIGAETIIQTAVQAIQQEADQPVDMPGKSLFTVNCAACHANGGNIIRRGKNLKQKAMVRNGYGEVDAITSLITQGKGIMPAYADKLSEGEIGAIAQYVHQKATTGW